MDIEVFMDYFFKVVYLVCDLWVVLNLLVMDNFG